MTWYLATADAAPTDRVSPMGGQIPTRLQQFGGSGRDLWWRRDSWAAESAYRQELANEMEQALGGGVRRRLTSADDLRAYDNPKTRGHVAARLIGELRGLGDDGRFADFPTTAEEFDAEVQRRRKADFDQNRAMLDRGDSTTAKVMGEMAATVVEPASLLTLPLGGTMANAGRFIAAEAALGVGSDLPGVIREQQVARDLDFQPSNPAVELATSGIASAGFATVLVGAGRAVDYVRTRRKAEVAARPAETPGMDWDEGIDAVESRLRTGQDARLPPPSVQPPASSGGAVIDDGYFAAIRSAESGGNDAARNPLSSATGRYQFTRGTWEGLMRKHPGLGLTSAGRLDPAQQERAIRAFTADNAKTLQGAGIPINRGNLYAAHFLGAGDAVRVLRSRGETRLTDLLSPAVIKANPFLRDMTVTEFNGWTARKTSGTSGGAPIDAGDLPSGSGLDWPEGSQPLPLPRFDQVTTPGGMSVDVRYRVADLSELTRASGDLQPRDRSRRASDEQIAGIAANLDPRRLMPSIEATGGAPVVGPDGLVESGNGRVAALARAAAEHPDRYRSYIQAIEDAGYEIPDGLRQPVLIAERVSDLDIEARRRFVRESNTSSTGRMSATEQAGVDADYLTQHAFDGFQPGRGLNAPDNAEFVRRIFANMPQAERAALMSAEGRLNIDGLRRLRQALFARAFEADDLLKLLAESDHPAVENLLRMLEDLAPDWAFFRAMVEAGQIRPEFDISDPLMDVVRTIAKARIENRDGQSVIGVLRDRLAQTDMFADKDDDLAGALVGVFYRDGRARSAEATSSILQRYIAEASEIARDDIGDMFAASDPVTPAGVLSRAVEDQDARAPMPSQFDAATPEAPQDGGIDLRGVDGTETKDGAQSAALTRASDAARRDLAASQDDGPFGPVFRAESGDPAAAIERLLREQTGEVPDAFTHPDFGSIDFVFGKADQNGKGGFGLAHILNDRANGQDVIARLPQILRDGTWTAGKSGRGRDRIVVDFSDGADWRAAISLTYGDEPRKWVLTAHRVYREGQPGEVEDGLRSTPIATSTALPDVPGPSRDSTAPGDFQADEAEAVLAEARAAAAADPDLEIRLGEGDDAQSFDLREILDGLDQDETLIARMRSCNLKGTPK